MNRIIALTVGGLLLIGLLLFSMTYTVSFHEVAIKSTFGQADDDDVITEPGLKFKLPIFADRVTKLDTRLQYLQSSDSEIITADDQTVVILAFLLWRVDVENAIQFQSSYETMENARTQLKPRFNDAVASAVSRFAFDDLLGPDNRQADAEQAVLDQLSVLKETGMTPVAVGISQIKLPPKATQAVLKRMNATRSKLADSERRKGDAEAASISGQTSTNAQIIRTFATQRATEIEAETAERTEQYLAKMSEDESLAIFLLWLDALEDSLNSNTTFILDMDSAPFHLLNLQANTDEDGIPQPKDGAMTSTPATDDNNVGGE